MSTSFVTLGRAIDGSAAKQGSQIGFWINDANLELLLRLLALQIEDPASTRPTGTDGERAARVIRDQWLLASRGWFVGCVPHGLEETMETRAGATIVRGALAALSVALADAPSTLPRGIVALLGIEGRFGSDIPIGQLRACADALGDLLDGRMQTTSRDAAIVPSRGQR